jgi:hypothetical protein
MDINVNQINKDAKEFYYSSIACNTKEGTDSDDSALMIEDIVDFIIKQINKILIPCTSIDQSNIERKDETVQCL